MRSVPLVMRGKLCTTSLEANIAGVMIGLTIDKTIRSVMEIVEDLMVELGRNLAGRGLVVSLLVMRSLLSMRSAKILRALGIKGDLGEVEAPQHKDPLPVVVLQPRGVLRQQGILAKARHPLTGALSTLNARAHSQGGRRCPTSRSWNTLAR